MRKKISVIIPVYNVEKYLERCIESILGQSYTNLQIIVVNDGSTDSSREILNKYHDQRMLILDKVNGGLSSARNEGLKYIDGDYVSFVDSDDWIDCQMFEEMLKVAEKYDADIVTVFEKVVSDSTSLSCSEEIKDGHSVYYNDECASQLFCNKVPSYSWGKLFKSSLFSSSGITFPEGENYEDVATNYLLFDRCRTLCVIHKRMYFYYMRQNSIVHTRSIENAVSMINHLYKMESYHIKNKYWGFYRLKGLYGTSMYLKSLPKSVKRKNEYKDMCDKVDRLKRNIKTERNILTYFGLPNFYKVIVLKLNLIGIALSVKSFLKK